METNVGGTHYGKHRASEPDAVKKGTPLYSGKSSQCCDTLKHATSTEDQGRASSSRKHSKFPSLSRIGRSNTFSFGRKKDKRNADVMSEKNSKSADKNTTQFSQDRKQKENKAGRMRAQDHSSYKDKSSSFEERSAQWQAKTKTQDGRYVNYENSHRNVTSRRSDVGRSRSFDVRSSVEGKENRTSSRDYSSSPSRSKQIHGRDRANPRRKDCKRKEVPIDRGYDYDNIPLWLRNPPKILIQDFSSDYVDETTFDEEYFDLVQWAFRILEQQCNYLIYPPFTDLEFDDDEPTLLGAVPGQRNEPLKVITNETARVGSTLDYILHPISTGAANVLQTGAKFANFTSRVFRGINFDSLIKKRNDEEETDKKKG